MALNTQPPNRTLILFALLQPELITGVIRICMFLNWAYFEMRHFPIDYLRISFTCAVTLGTASTTALGIRVYHVHQEATNPPYKSSTTHKWFRAFVGFIVILLCVDIAHVIYVFFATELFNSAILGAFYTAIQLPVSVFFFLFA